MKQTIFKLARYSALSLLFSSSCLYASGYKLEFQSASTLADAGEAASINDAGTNWYNAAGLVYLPQQYVVSAIDVYAPAKFTGSVTGGSAFGSAFNYHASGSASSHSNSLLPAIHYSYPYNDRVAIGISIVPAWGFMEYYGNNSLVRYDTDYVSTKSIDIGPSIAVKINNQWSIGAGPDFHYFYVKSQSEVFTEGAPPPFATPGDSRSKYSASRWGFGGHAGLLFKINEATRIGLNYRSKLTMNLHGTSGFQLNSVGYFETNNFKLNVPLPATTTLSAYHEFTPRFALMGTLAFDQWSTLDKYQAQNYIQPTGIVPTVISQQNMHSTVDVSAGAHYKLNDKWLLRGSFKYEPTPTSSNFRDVNFPDGRKLGLQIGARYQMNKAIAVDMIYGHVFVLNTHINGVYPQQIFPNTTAASGNSHTSIDLLGAQLVWNI